MKRGRACPTPAQSHIGDRILLVFAKAPVAGRVKTRLATSIGAEAATAVYRKMGREILDRVRSGPWKTVVCHDPPSALGAVREWLGDGVEYWSQGRGDLGHRMARAFEKAHRLAGQVCLVGTDVPDLDGVGIETAFRALDCADVVLGPATDGGYYLLATSRSTPALFQDISWSTDAVLTQTERICDTLGLVRARLAPLADVDTAEDLDSFPELARCRALGFTETVTAPGPAGQVTTQKGSPRDDT